MPLQLLLVSIEASIVTDQPKKQGKEKGMLECLLVSVHTNGKLNLTTLSKSSKCQQRLSSILLCILSQKKIQNSIEKESKVTFIYSVHTASYFFSIYI